MRLDKCSLLLYAVTDRRWLDGRTLYSQAEEALKGGTTFLQLREKTLDMDAFRAEALEMKTLCRRFGVPFVHAVRSYLAGEFHVVVEHERNAETAAERLHLKRLGTDCVPAERLLAQL